MFVKTLYKYVSLKASSSTFHSNLSSSNSPDDLTNFNNPVSDSNLGQLFDDLQPLNPEPLRQWPIIQDVSDESSEYEDESASSRTREDRDKMLSEAMALGSKYFGNEPSLNYTSFYINHDLRLDHLTSHCQCSYSIPNKDKGIWMMPIFGWHAIPLVLFYYGVHIPIHPFHSRVLEAIECGLSQLAPNAYLQQLLVVLSLRCLLPLNYFFLYMS